MDLYKELYFKLFNAVTDTLNALTHAQLDCEAQVVAEADRQDTPETTTA